MRRRNVTRVDEGPVSTRVVRAGARRASAGDAVRWGARRAALLSLRRLARARLGLPRAAETARAEADAQVGGAPRAREAHRVISVDLAQRLRAHVLVQSSGDTRVLTCEFAAGGRKHGVGIPSPLYCVTCGHSQVLHDIAAALPCVEREARPPLLRGDVAL